MKKLMKCILCDGFIIETVFKSKNTEYYQCKTCSHVFTPKLPPFKYEQYHNDKMYIRLREYLENAAEQCVDRVLKYKTHGIVLEIGCSVGILLERFNARGFQVMGVEPSHSAVMTARKRGFEVHEGFFEKVPVPKVDIIVASHVLEHVYQPNEVVQKAHRSLRKNGLVVFRVPNFGSIEAQLTREKWRFLVPDEHVSQFTPQTLRLLLEQNGFQILEMNTLGSLTEFSNFPKEIIRCIRHDQKRLVYYCLEYFRTFIPALTDRETTLHVIAKKV